MRFVILFILVMVFSSFSEVSKINIRKFKRRKSFGELVFTSNATLPQSIENKKALCKWLRSSKYQSKVCTQKGLGVILLEAKALALNACHSEFEYEQWNCKNFNKAFKKMYRETAFMAALSTSALTYSIAKGCSKELTNCECATHGKELSHDDWQWGGCGDNTAFARKLTNTFLQMRKKLDNFDHIMKYNNKLGLSLVLKSEKRVCKCHGVSRSCTMKICFKQIQPFDKIANSLRNQYHSAIRVQLTGASSIYSSRSRPKKLIYLDDSPNFCALTIGRRCLNAEICATLCCGRGFTPIIRTVKKPCNFRFVTPQYKLEYDICYVNETLRICK